jgi:hypothetical protein
VAELNVQEEHVLLRDSQGRAPTERDCLPDAKPWHPQRLTTRSSAPRPPLVQTATQCRPPVIQPATQCRPPLIQPATQCRPPLTQPATQSLPHRAAKASLMLPMVAAIASCALKQRVRSTEPYLGRWGRGRGVGWWGVG